MRASAERSIGPGIHAGLGKRIAEEVAERIVAHLAHERRRDSQTRQADRDVGRRAARRLAEARALRQRDAGGIGHEVDQRFAQANHLRSRLGMGDDLFEERLHRLPELQRHRLQLFDGEVEVDGDDLVALDGGHLARILRPSPGRRL